MGRGTWGGVREGMVRVEGRVSEGAARRAQRRVQARRARWPRASWTVFSAEILRERQHRLGDRARQAPQRCRDSEHELAEGVVGRFAP
jgi:hypothetical protein